MAESPELSCSWPKSAAEPWEFFSAGYWAFFLPWLLDKILPFH